MPARLLPLALLGLCAAVPPALAAPVLEVQAVDLLNHYTRVVRTLEVKPRRGTRAPRA